MNEKDLEAFECWQKEIIQELKFNNAIGDNKHKGSLKFAWQAACKYKQKEYSNIIGAMTQTSQNNFKLQAENKQLREALIKISEIGYYHDYGDHRRVASEALEETTSN